MDEIRETVEVVVKTTRATASAEEAVKKAVEDKKTTATDWSKLVTKLNIFEHKSQEGEMKAFREWSWVFGKQLSSVAEAYMKHLKETHDKPNESFDMDLATTEEKTRCINLYGLLASLMRGRAPRLVKAVEDPNGFDAWRSLSKAWKPTSKAKHSR